MSAEQDKKNGQDLFENGRYDEAIPFLKSATATLSMDEELWSLLVLAASRTAQHEQAVEFARSALNYLPSSHWLWQQLGNELTELEILDEAEQALNRARNLNPNTQWLWRYFANLYQKRRHYDKEAQALENLHLFIEPEANDFNRLGIAYYNSGHFAKAVESYRLAFAKRQDAVFLFNMALVYSRPNMSQDIDAVDAYRRALLLHPDHERAKQCLAEQKRRVITLASQARVSFNGVIHPNDGYQFYLNPFEVLQIEPPNGATDLDVKVLQRAKKRLLQEIELNDGKVSWLDNRPLDKSRVLLLDDELQDTARRRYHCVVFQNKRLLSFLTRGEIQHFLYSEEYFPKQDLELLEREPEFRTFLSEPFSRQYNLLLSRAFERKALAVIEALFDGRRWVLPEHDDICFEGAYRRVRGLVELLRAKTEEAQTRKVGRPELEELLHSDALLEIFNLLPVAFRQFQMEAVTHVRSIAIDNNNRHGDPDVSRSVLELCNHFKVRGIAIDQNLEKDFATLKELIAEERKYETHLTFGSKRAFKITKEGVRDGNDFFPARTVRTLRWGINVTGYSGAERYDYLFIVGKDSGESIVVNWSADKSTAGKQTELFNEMVQAAVTYIAQWPLKTIQQSIGVGASVRIGPCSLAAAGISFQTQGRLFKKDRFIPWPHVSTKMRNGRIIVMDERYSDFSVEVLLRDTDNAVLLPLLPRFINSPVGA